MIWARQGNNTNRVLRGGAWNNNANNARCADRNNNGPSNTNNNIGFRCVRRIRECVTAFQAERGRPRLPAASDPKAHLPPPVSAKARGNEPGKSAGTGSAKRTSRRGAAVAALALLLGLAATALATYSESNVFAFDTRDSNATHYADSALFVFDTRDSNSTHYGESNLFAFNTRAFDGLSSARASGDFILDTRSATATGLTIVGPANVTTGSQTEYRIVMNDPVSGTSDVTIPSLLGFVGGPPTWAGIGGTTLFILRTAPAGATVQLQARYGNGAGQVLSPPFAVTIGAAFYAGLTATPQAPVGNSHTIALSGRATGGTPPYTAWRWDTNGDGVYGDETGQTASFSRTSTGETLRIGLEVTDAAGVKAFAPGIVVLKKAPAANEPPRVALPKYPVGMGVLRDEDGNDFQIDTGKAANGLIIITHGVRAKGTDAWVKSLAKKIRERIEADKGVGALPNIVVYDWGEDSNPSELPKDGIAALKWITRASSQAGFGFASFAGHSALAVAAFADLRNDLYYVQDIAYWHGSSLANWVWLETRTNPKEVDPTKPIHLIGHSAGGFTVGECASVLKEKGITVDLVTMLDTPLPYPHHLSLYPNPGYVERYISSDFGLLSSDAIDAISPNTYYRYVLLPGVAVTEGFGALVPNFDHDGAHEWYETNTVVGTEQTGFWHSPFAGGPWAATKSPSPPSPSSTPPPPAESTMALDGFSSFGGVVESSGAFGITEGANAGISRQITFPIGARSLSFQYQFMAQGDGDYLEVTFEDHDPLFIGLDLPITRDAPLTARIPITEFAGETGVLTFTLVSRGSANSVLQLQAIVLTTSDDPDGDGLATAQELALGTDPLDVDSDADGVGDSEELHLFHISPLTADSDADGQNDADEIAAGTDPGDARSVMTVLAFSRAGSGVALRWTSVRGKSYRVLRSNGPGFASYEVLGSGLVAAGTQMEFLDPAVLTALVPAMFYRVEVEAAPPAPELDSDFDGVPDAQEIAAESDPGRYDTDGDGLGDGEEMLALHTSPIRTDSDGDGSSDWAELVAGTSPTNPASVLAITGIVRNADASVSLRWSGVAGRTYRVLRSLTPEFSTAQVIVTGWPGLPPTTTFTDTSAAGLGNGTAFYRVMVE